MEDKLTDIEQIEYYKNRLKSKKEFFVMWSVLIFVLGFVVARIIYKSIPEAFDQVRKSKNTSE